MITRRQWLKWTGYGALGVMAGCVSGVDKGPSAKSDVPYPLVGYSRLRTNIPGGRYENSITMRAWAVRADGTEARPLAEELSREPHSWTQFAGWSPDGRYAIIGRGWESPENGAWEEEHRTFRMTEGWRYDMHLLDWNTGALTNLTEVERVSEYNTGLLFIPGDSGQLGFQALINGESHPFVMDRDGRNKRDMTSGKKGFTYGMGVSPDGKYLSYHKDYKVFIADAKTAEARQIDTGQAFNFGPQWSPDGKWVLFVAGADAKHADPYIVRHDGTGLRKVASRNGYWGSVLVLDVFDYHEGSSDVPVWAADSQGIFYTAQQGASVQLMWGSLEGETRQLTHTPENTLQYHPRVSLDGHWLVFGSNRTGTRQLYARPADPFVKDHKDLPLTNVEPGNAAMWACILPV